MVRMGGRVGRASALAGVSGGFASWPAPGFWAAVPSFPVGVGGALAQPVITAEMPTQSASVVRVRSLIMMAPSSS
jgi:hypothetical protein